jgi:hypothetical protein
MFFAAWLLRTLFETAWTFAPTLFLGSTYGIANNDKDNQAKEERRGLGKMSTTHIMTISKKLIGRNIFMLISV